MAALSEQPAGVGARGALGGVQAGACWLARHWLALANTTAVGLLLGSLAVPVAAAAGLGALAAPAFDAYRLVCHQQPDRSFFLLGEQMAICQRDLGIFAGVAVAGLGLVRVRPWARPLPWRPYLLLAAPMAVDGATQYAGLRASVWELRLLTGVLFGASTAWVAYPRLDRLAAATLGELMLGAKRGAPGRVVPTAHGGIRTK